MNTFVSALLVGLVSVFCMLDSRLLGRLNFEQPLVGATLVGVVLGDPMTGLAVGAAAELVSMGLVSVGAAVPADMVLGSIIAAAFACLTGASAETAMTIAVPVAVLGQLLGIVFRSVIAVSAIGVAAAVVLMDLKFGRHANGNGGGTAALAASEDYDPLEDDDE